MSAIRFRALASAPRLWRWLPRLVLVVLVGLRVYHLEDPGPGSVPDLPGASGSIGEPSVDPPSLLGEEAPPAAEPHGDQVSLAGADRDPGSSTAAPTLDEFCDQIDTRLASVSADDCAHAGFAASGGSSVGGLPLLVRDMPADSPSGSLGRVLLIGGIHGDELSSVSIVFRWNRLLDSRGTGPFDWRVVPALNPDGLLLEPSSRLNANGVDLNRNFPTSNWQQATRDYWVRRTSRNPRRYPGEAALSEPESRWLALQIDTFRPDVIVSVHAPHGVLDFDGPPRAPESLGSLALQPIGTYPGSLGLYAGVQSGLRVVTIELERAGIMPSPEEQSTILEDLGRWLEERFLVDAGRGDSLVTATRTSAGS